MRTAISIIRRKLGDYAENPTLHPHRAPCRLPDAKGEDTGAADGVTAEGCAVAPVSVGFTACGERPAKPPLPSCLRGGTVGQRQLPWPLAECGVAAPDEMVEPPTLLDGQNLDRDV